ncbi:MAG: ribonuclease HII [Betaproteobacteria bacterium]|nr:ribonuclease HII [Betaproteobacteria bacterium]
MPAPRTRERAVTGAAAGPTLAGVDEAGRGPLAGAVYAAAVILDPSRPITGLADSKQLSSRRRESLAGAIREYSLAWSIAFATVEEIDRINILQASLLAMKRAVDALKIPAAEICVDGLHVPAVSCPARAMVEGDRLVPAISAASILAKVARDEEMLAWDARYPDYGFARHKGYGTAEHLAALKRHGPCPIHRVSFAPVRAALAQSRLAF